MAFVVKLTITVSISSQCKVGGISGCKLRNSGFQTMPRTLVSAVMSSNTAQNVENLSVKAKDIGLPIMVLTLYFFFLIICFSAHHSCAFSCLVLYVGVLYRKI